MLKATGNIWKNSVITGKAKLFHYTKKIICAHCEGLIYRNERSLNKIHALPPEKKRCAVLCMP